MALEEVTQEKLIEFGWQRLDGRWKGTNTPWMSFEDAKKFQLVAWGQVQPPRSEWLTWLEPEEFCMWWRTQYPSAYLALAEAAGLVVLSANGPMETEPGTRDSERLEAILEALKTLVGIDPDGRR